MTNGFWRRPELQSGPEITEELRAAHETLAAAGSLAVNGGGAAGVNTAAHHAPRWPDHRVDLYYPQTPTHREVFAVGDLAGTFRAPRARWGSVLGTQPNGIEVFTASGGVIRFPSWTGDRLLLAWYVRRHMYGGIRRRPTC